MKNENFITVIGKIKKEKNDKRLTNAELSIKSGVPLGTLNKILSGATQSVKVETLNKIANALDINAGNVYPSSNDNIVIDNENYGFVKVGAYTPEIKVADVEFNVINILHGVDEALQKNVSVLVFPELCITGATCGDLFYQPTLLNSALNGLIKIKNYSKGKQIILFVGLPLKIKGNIIDGCACVCDGKILGVTPKNYIRSYASDEARVFTVGYNGEVVIGDEVVPVLDNIIYRCESLPDLSITAEVGSDIYAPTPKSVICATAGANIIVNSSATVELVGSSENMETLLKSQSLKCASSYVYANAGIGESTSDCVYAGGNYIVENGSVINRSEIFTTGLTVSDIDVGFLAYKRTRLNIENNGENVIEIPFNIAVKFIGFDREFSKTPFIPSTNLELKTRAEFILNLQAQALAKRIKHINCNTLVLGVSGGLDSTLALLVCKRAMDLVGRSSKDILAVTMPCFGTTARTKNNAIIMSEALGVTLKEVNIKEAVRVHFKDIGHDESVTDVTYENAQARERTQVLMDISNMYNGIVIGTGDLSEMALGWATYNGDHMSMYSVNANIPKTLIRYLVGYEADRLGSTIKKVLNDVLDTPVSPELIPPTGEEIKQKTEDIVGPYLLHDFYIYYALQKGYSPSKLYTIAKHVFKGDFDNETLYKWLKNFYRRFFIQQFKRNCVPDGVKVGSLSFSPRGDLKMPSDAVSKEWFKELEKLEI